MRKKEKHQGELEEKGRDRVAVVVWLPRKLVVASSNTYDLPYEARSSNVVL